MENYKGIYGYWDKQKKVVAYVGKDSNMSERKREKDHLAQSNFDSQPFNKVLQNNFNRYEYFEIIRFPNDTPDEVINDIEIIAITRYGTYENRRGFGKDYGYNFTKGGEGATGHEVSEATRNKISKSLKGENHPMYGKSISEEAKKNLSESRIGEKNPMYGKHHSDEARARMSKARKKEKHPHWKEYPRIIKAGFNRGKQFYGLKYKGEYIIRSTNKEQVEKKLNEILNGEYNFDEKNAKKKSKSGENSPRWKDYPRITKAGSTGGKQLYGLTYEGKIIMRSVHKEKLEKKLNEILNGNYNFDEENAKRKAKMDKNNPHRKAYPRITKSGFSDGKQLYALRHEGKVIMRSVHKEKLELELKKILNDN